MASRRTWLWIILGAFGFSLLILFAVAGAGVYFVSQHFSTAVASSEEASRAFDEARARFKDSKPLYELDDRERPHATRDLRTMPDSPVKPQNLWILAWDNHEERTIKVSLPLWLLRLGNQKIQIAEGTGGFDLERLELDVRQLERVGPMLLFEFRENSGDRVIVWTQ